MPTYEYVCDACKHEWELEQRMSDAPAKKCPKCGKLKAHRQISAGNFILKGGGWYSDLYSSSSASSKKSSSESKSESKSETKSESKTETKSETKSEKSDKKAKAASE